MQPGRKNNELVGPMADLGEAGKKGGIWGAEMKGQCVWGIMS